MLVFVVLVSVFTPLDKTTRSYTQAEILLGLLPVFVLLSWVRGFRRLSFLNVLGNLSLVLGEAKGRKEEGREE